MNARRFRRLCCVLLLGLGCWAVRVQAHEFKLDMVMNAFVVTGPGQVRLVIRAPLYLFKSAKFPVAGAEIDVDKAGPAVERALASLQHDVTLFANGRLLTASQATARLSLPSDRSFDSYEHALHHVDQPLEPGTHVFIDQGYVDAVLTYPFSSQGAELTIRTTAARELGDALKLALRFMPAGEEGRAMVVTSRSGIVALNPTWLRAASGFSRLGLVHILSGVDHLLFLLCLMVPLRGWRQILSVVTVFTAAHSFTLIGSAFGLAPTGRWFPPFVEMAIAASIVYMALENIMGVRLQRRVLVTGLFGMVHGFGFSSGLQENFSFAGTHLLVSLFAFNVGIELGQILVLAVMLPALALVRRYVLPGRVGMIILSAALADIGWHWMIDRADALWREPWPALSASGMAALAAWLVGILLAARALSLLTRRLGSVGASAAPLLR